MTLITRLKRQVERKMIQNMELTLDQEGMIFWHFGECMTVKIFKFGLYFPYPIKKIKKKY